MLGTRSNYYKHSFSTKKQAQDNMATSKIKALASHRLHVHVCYIVRDKDQRDVRVTRAVNHADDCRTDHRMVRSVMSVQVPPKRRKQGKQMQRRLNIEQLKEEGIKTNFQFLLNENLPVEYPDDVEQHWSILKTAMLSACQKTTGFLKRQHQDWFDENNEEIQSVIDQKRTAYNI